jgi:hypothetical protein
MSIKAVKRKKVLYIIEDAKSANELKLILKEAFSVYKAKGLIPFEPKVTAITEKELRNYVGQFFDFVIVDKDLVSSEAMAAIKTLLKYRALSVISLDMQKRKFDIKITGDKK